MLGCKNLNICFLINAIFNNAMSPISIDEKKNKYKYKYKSVSTI